MLRPPPAVVLLALVAAAAAARSAPSQRGLAFDGRALGEARATLDPTGALELEGEGADGAAAFRLCFRALDLPSPGHHDLGASAPEAAVRAQQRTEAGWVDLLAGDLELDALDAERAAGKLSFARNGARHELVFDLAPELAREAHVHGARALPACAPPADTPSRDDLVFCALGGTGTGLPGARSIADAIARLAPSGPLDFVLLLGDSICPRGVASVADAAWRSRFEDVFDARRLPMPFYAVCGEAEARGDPTAVVAYGVSSPRWTAPDRCYSFEVESHGATFTFVGLDTPVLLDDLGVPANREMLRTATRLIESSTADWKIVFGFHAMSSNGEAHGTTSAFRLGERLERPFLIAGVDLYLAGEGGALELLAPATSTLHLTSGAGGGPEMAQPVAWRDDTLFAHTGGGFAWLRYDGRALEISFRDATGQTLYVHRLSKARREAK